MLKIRKLFPLFLISIFLVSSIGIFPAGVHRTVSPMIEKGPEAVLADVMASSDPAYGLFTCQVGLIPGVVCYDPYQMRHAYGIDTLINAGLTGKGKTIVIVDSFQSPNIVDQLNYFDTYYGLPGLNGLGSAPDKKLGKFTQIAPDGLTPFDPTDDGMVGWAFEISLDVLWAHAIAPGANITLVLAKTNDDADIFSATKYAVDHKLGDVISQSFGEDESCMDPKILANQHKLFMDATRKNMTLFASSGDQGASQPTCDGSSFSKAVSSPASDPLVTAVGGTELHAADYCLEALGCDPTANPVAGTYQDEIVWNEFDSESTGGGFSVLYDTPLYQKGIVRGKQLGVPDVSYNAAIYHGVLTWIDIPGTESGWYLIGGTSAGSPQWAAITAIADQKYGRNVGFINAALYQIGRDKRNYVANFFDVTSGNNSVIEQDVNGNEVAVEGFNAGPGWDATTGLGSPKADVFVKTLIRTVRSDDWNGNDWGPHNHGNPPWHGGMHEH